MKAILALALGLAAPAAADFYLYTGVTVDDSGKPQDPLTFAVSANDRGNCDGIENSPFLDGAEGEWAYPWPEDEFTTKDPLCNIALKFTKKGDDYDVYDSVTDEHVGTCTEGNGETKSCFYLFISTTYQEDYFCTSPVCS